MYWRMILNILFSCLYFHSANITDLNHIPDLGSARAQTQDVYRLRYISISYNYVVYSAFLSTLPYNAKATPETQMWGLISDLQCFEQQLPLGLLVLKCCSPEQRTWDCVHTKHGWNAIIFQSLCLSFSALKRWLLLENNAKPLIMKLSRRLCAQDWLSLSVFVIPVKHPIRLPSKSREMRLTMETKLFNCYYLWKSEVLFFFHIV